MSKVVLEFTDMPYNCSVCPLRVMRWIADSYCAVTKQDLKGVYGKRHDDCPLEVIED